MQKLNLPDYDFDIRTDGKKTKIFDELRKKELILTPEEWVRQHLVKYLVYELGYPKGLIAIEKGMNINALKKRADIVCYDRDRRPVLIVECKAANVTINQNVFDQIARYNIHFKVPYLLVSNGMKHYCALINFEKGSFSFLKALPRYDELEI